MYFQVKGDEVDQKTKKDVILVSLQGVYPYDVLSVKGIEMMTPFPVPTHNRFPPISRAVILTKEKPNFPVPVNQRQDSRMYIVIAARLL